MATNLTSIHGRKLGISNQGHLVGNAIDLMDPCVDCTITVAAEDTNVRQIAIQLLDANGNAITRRTVVDVVVLADANGDAFASTGGSTGIELGAGGDGAILAVVAKKYFKAISEADGDIDLKYTDTGTEACYLGVILPTGRMVISSALTNT
jgi:hypothetical protein